MTNGFFGRLFGGNKPKSTNNKKLTPKSNAPKKQQKSPSTSKPPSPSPSSPSSPPPKLAPLPPSPSPSLPTPSMSPSPSPSSQQQQSTLIEKINNDMNDFYNIQGTNNNINSHLNDLNSVLNYKNEYQDDYFTISSATSSNLSLQDALFSHLSTSDTQSEITQFSDFPKIAVRTQSQQVFDHRPYSVADNIDSNDYLDLYDDNNTKQLYEIYIDALRYLSPKSMDRSPAQAFRLFEYIANQQESTNATHYLIAYAQYHTGRMLYEAYYSVENDQNEHVKQQGLKYLLDASKNGITCATFMLGFYAECDGDVEYACNIYYQAAIKGQLLAKVYFGNTVLFKNVNGYQVNDAIFMLNEASNQVAQLLLTFFSFQ